MEKHSAATAPRYIALGSRLVGVPEVCTLGVKLNFQDYTELEQQQILDASVILYPTLNYAQFFTTMGKRIFPSVETYLYADEKIKQTTLFHLLSIPHPRTKFYLKRDFSKIQQDFDYPFIAKIPRGSACGRGVFMISDQADLEQYLQKVKTAYIQEYLPHERDLRVILINYEPVLAYWRRRAPDDFKTNLYQGGRMDFADVPDDIMPMVQEYARRCKFNDVGLDLIEFQGSWYLIEANMLYGREGFKKKNLVLKEVIRQKLLDGTLLA
jgi:ribosomal protein S6--L-glutamate ligase